MRARIVLVGVLIAVAALVAACSTGGSPTKPATPPPPSKPITAIAPTALIIDASDSMLTDDAPGLRMDAAKKAATNLVDAVPDGSRMAVLTYGTGTGNAPSERRAGCRDVSVLVPLGPLDKTSATAAIDGVTPRGFTPIAASLSRAADQLPTDQTTSIVLISDGEDTCGTPPCDVARELKKSHPKLSISTVGFKTSGDAGDALRCIAEETGGMFVEAANGAQLTARLLATQDESSRTTTVNGSSYNGIDLGTTLGDVRREHDDFPAEPSRTDGDRTIYVWLDCEWAFDGDRLVEIRPGSGATTIDGIGPGSTVADAIEFYGQPQSDETSGGTRTLIFDAGTGDGTGYRMTADGDGDSGTITRIVVCGCAKTGTSTTSTSLPGAPPTTGGCDGRVVGQTDVKHPRLGMIRVFLINDPSTTSTACLIPVTTDGRALTPAKVEAYGDSIEFASPSTDSTGNTFVTYNPGRYDGVLVLVPTDSGFAQVGTGDGGYMGPNLYYYAELTGPGSNGEYTIEQSENDCEPDCAGGTVTKKTLRWNGHEYAE